MVIPPESPASLRLTLERAANVAPKGQSIGAKWWRLITATLWAQAVNKENAPEVWDAVDRNNYEEALDALAEPLQRHDPPQNIRLLVTHDIRWT